MSELDLSNWDEFSEYLQEKLKKSGLSDEDSMRRADAFNFWSSLGFSFDSLSKDCRSHFGSLERGESPSGDGFPQVNVTQF